MIEPVLSLLKARLSQQVKAEDLVRPGTLTSFVNPFSYLQLRTRPDLIGAMTNWCLDGKTLQTILNMAWKSHYERNSFDFTSLAGPVFSLLQDQGKRLSIIGSDETSLQRFLTYLTAEYPRLQLVHARNGYFQGDSDVAQTCQTLCQIQSDFVLVGMGAVRQEEFLVSLQRAGFTGAGATCGGFIHQTAKRGRNYYPDWINRANLRFLYRMYDEPALVKRYAIEYPKGYKRLLGDLLAHQAHERQ